MAYEPFKNNWYFTFTIFGIYFRVFYGGFWFRNKNGHGNGYAFRVFRSYKNLIFSHRNRMNKGTIYFKYCFIQKLQAN